MVPIYILLKSEASLDFARNTFLLKSNQTTKKQENIRKNGDEGMAAMRIRRKELVNPHVVS